MIINKDTIKSISSIICNNSSFVKCLELINKSDEDIQLDLVVKETAEEKLVSNIAHKIKLIIETMDISSIKDISVNVKRQS